MSEFDSVARTWDQDKMHTDRAVAIASQMQQMIPLHPAMKALEYGAGTGLLSFELKDSFASITLMDNSAEMIKVCAEKTEYHKTSHIFPICFDLEHKDFDDSFDIIYNQMVMHHVGDYESILGTFYSMLHPGGYLAIADLFAEDGSFHGPEVKVHWGFDPEELAKMLRKIGFQNIVYRPVFEVLRENGRKYPVFLLTAQK
jgi:ubiquinone/menaquinone biosynthesis C-methylase UbiE